MNRFSERSRQPRNSEAHAAAMARLRSSALMTWSDDQLMALREGREVGDRLDATRILHDRHPIEAHAPTAAERDELVSVRKGALCVSASTRGMLDATDQDRASHIEFSHYLRDIGGRVDRLDWASVTNVSESRRPYSEPALDIEQLERASVEAERWVNHVDTPAGVVRGRRLARVLADRARHEVASIRMNARGEKQRRRRALLALITSLELQVSGQQPMSPAVARLLTERDAKANEGIVWRADFSDHMVSHTEAAALGLGLARDGRIDWGSYHPGNELREERITLRRGEVQIDLMDHSINSSELN